VLGGERSAVVDSGGSSSEVADEGEGSSRRAMTGLWSDVVYEGMEVYSNVSIEDWVGDWSEADA
jgi:hypothetical protein